MRSSSSTECRIPDDHVLGEVHGDGVRVLMSGLDYGAARALGGPIGIMQAALDLVLPYVRERRQFGVPIGSFELMQGKLADMYVALESSRAFAYASPAAFDREPGARHRSAPPRHACCTRPSARCEVALEAIQALGGAGYLNESARRPAPARREALHDRRRHDRDPTHADRAGADGQALGR